MRRLSVILFFSFCILIPAAGQSMQSLRDQIKRAEDEIRRSNQLLEKNRRDQKISLEQLKLIQARIENRKEIVTSLEGQIKLIGNDIEGKSNDIRKLGGDLDSLKKDYAGTIYEGYKNYKLNNFTLFLFSSRDFNDATKRLAYIRRYNTDCEVKAVHIDSLSRSLTVQVADLNRRKEELDQTKKSRSNELTVLSKDEVTYKNSVATLKKGESKLSSTVRARQAQIAKAQQQIQNIVAQEAKKAAEARKKSVAVSKEAAIIDGKFDQNMGRLPYPVTGGVVIDRYGVHEHPTQKGLKVDNKGINIATPRGAEVCCVYDGVVTNVFFFQGLNNSVMVRHGSYITVYSNLAEVGVKKGDKVGINQRLGAVSDGSNQADHMLHFEIWKETTNLNPSLWLRR